MKPSICGFSCNKPSYLSESCIGAYTMILSFRGQLYHPMVCGTVEPVQDKGRTVSKPLRRTQVRGRCNGVEKANPNLAAPNDIVLPFVFVASNPLRCKAFNYLLFLPSWNLDRLGQVRYNIYNKRTRDKELLDNQRFFALYERRPEKEDCLFKPQILHVREGIGETRLRNSLRRTMNGKKENKRLRHRHSFP